MKKEKKAVTEKEEKKKKVTKVSAKKHVKKESEPVSNVSKTTKKKKQEMSSETLYTICTIVALLIVVVLVIFLMFGRNEEPEENQPFMTEEEIIENYQMSKEDAIDIVSKYFHNDFYEFEATVEDDGTYTVVAHNTELNTFTKYRVEPSTKKATYIK